MCRRRAAIGRKIDLDRHKMLRDRRTDRLSAVGFADLPRVEDDGHQRATTLRRDSISELAKPANLTLDNACLPLNQYLVNLRRPTGTAVIPRSSWPSLRSVARSGCGAHSATTPL